MFTLPKFDASVLFEALPTLRSTDPQLGQWVEEKIQQGDDWSTAVAAGMIARLPHPPKGAAARQLLQSLLHGTPPPPTSWQLFAQSWTDEQIRWIQALFQTKLASLAEEIDRLMLAGFDEDTDESETSNHDAPADLRVPDSLNPTAQTSASSAPEHADGAPLSSSDALDLLLRRDELACVSLLLRARESFSEFTQPLELLDQTGSAWVHSLDMTTDISQHPTLQRILQHDPTAWWAYPAATTILVSSQTARRLALAKAQKTASIFATPAIIETLKKTFHDLLHFLQSSIRSLAPEKILEDAVALAASEQDRITLSTGKKFFFHIHALDQSWSGYAVYDTNTAQTQKLRFHIQDASKEPLQSDFLQIFNQKVIIDDGTALLPWDTLYTTLLSFSRNPLDWPEEAPLVAIIREAQTSPGILQIHEKP